MRKLLFISTLLSVMWGAWPQTSHAQNKNNRLQGTYTINGDNSANPDYTSIEAAIADLENNGISGSVNFEIAPGTYEAFLTLPHINGSSSNHKITFKGMGSGPETVILTSNAGYTEKHTLCFDNAAFTGFENLSITSSSEHFATLVKIENGFEDISFTQVRFEGAEVTSSTYNDDKHLVYETSKDAVDKNLSFEQCDFLNGYIALYLQGQGWQQPNDENLQIHDCSFVNQYKKSLYIQYQENADISQNTFVNTADISGEYIAIDAFRNYKSFIINANKFDINRTDNDFIAIKCRPCVGEANAPILIKNNMISMETSSTSFSYGIMLKDDECQNIHVLNNTMYLRGSSTRLNAININDAIENLFIYNNLLVNTSTGGGIYRYRRTTSTTTHIDYNRYELNADYFGRYGNTNMATLSDWQDASGFDANSQMVTASDLFVADNNLHITANTDLTVNHPLDLVPKDFDLALRSTTTPCVGADELSSNLPPYLAVPFDTVRFDAYPQTQTVSLDNHFEDPENDPINIEYSGVSSDKLSASIAGTTLSIVRESAEASLNEWVEIHAISGNDTVAAKITVELLSTDLPPVILNQIAPQQFNTFPQSITIDLNGAFTDPDNDDTDITYEAVSFDASKYHVTMDANNMTLARQTANAFTNSPLVLRAHSNGLYVDMTIEVSATASSVEPVMADFEDIELNSDSIWQAPNLGDNILIDKTWGFYNHTQEGYWGGFQVSSRKDTTTTALDAQYTAVTAGGYQGSAKYSVVYASYYPTDIFPQTGNDTEMLKGMYVTNNLWAYQAMRDGDNLATPFGGPSGNEPDYFRIRAVAFNANNVAFDTLYFYLADYRFEDNSQDYIVTDWRYFDLSSFGEVSKVRFSMESTKTNAGGIVTPAYFCMDNFYTDENVTDLPPEVTGELSIYISATDTIDVGNLLDVVTDPDNNDADIDFSINGGTNPAIANISIQDSLLTVVRVTDNYATLNLSITATSNGKSVDFEVPVTIDEFDNIEEFKLLSSINIYPNPAQEVLYMHTPIQGAYSIYNSYGQCVIKEKTIQPSLEQIDIKDFSKGIYIVKLKTAYGLKALKFVKQ